jgi:Nucleosome binding factor SPN, SPT16 subunit
MILVAVFVAILALAYFTYRNIVGLDTRLRKIEDVLKNAEVVAAPPSHAQEYPETPVHSAPTPGDYESNARVPGWGGEGPPVNVERVLPTDEPEKEDEIREMDLPIDEDDEGNEGDDETSDDEDGEDGEDGEDDEDADDGEDGKEDDTTPEENRREKSKYANVRVGDLRDALKKAGVSFPSGAKKALLVSLAEHNNVELSG